MDEKTRYSGILVDNYGLLMKAWPHSEDMHQKIPEEITQYANFDTKDRPIKVIEIGSGRGEATKPILDEERTIVTAIDKSEVMCDQLRTNLSRHIQSGRLTVHQADAFEYLSSVDERSYDVVASAWILHNFPRKDRTDLLRLMNRAIKKKGIFVMMDKVLSDVPQKEEYSLQKALKTYEFLLSEGKKDVYDAIVAHETEDHQDPYALREDEFTNDLLRTGFYRIEVGNRHHRDPSERDAIVIARKI